jgi:hypothetical protein
MIEVHQSGINTFLHCPKQFYYGNIKQLPETYGEALFLGSSVHYALKHYFKDGLSIKDTCNLLEVEIRTENNFLTDERFKPGSRIAYENHTDVLVSSGKELIVEYLNKIAGRYTVLENELSLSKKVTDNVTMAGTIDLMVYDNLEKETKLIDFKTTARKRTRIELLNDIQPTAYAYLVGGPIIFEYHALMRKTAPEIELWKVYRSQADIDWFIQELLTNFVKCVEQEIYVPNPSGWWCQPKFCSFFGICKRMNSIEDYLKGFSTGVA